MSTPKTNTLPDGLRAYDGIICFGGEDWWYHNRGHYDMQLMQRFARSMPVLYVNSIGMRIPRPGKGRVFLPRIARKLRSLSRGTVRITENFSVCSPMYAPTRHGQAVLQRLLAWQVREAAREAGIHHPLLWIACPPAAHMIDHIDHAGLVYQRTDRTECFSDVNRDDIRLCDRMLKARADLTLFCTASLLDEEHDQCRDVSLVDHGVDAQVFIDAGRHDPRDIAPCDLAAIEGPRVGFVGGIDAHTFDPDLLNTVASLLPDVRFPLIGGCSLPAGWNTQPNIHLLGRKPYNEVAMYMAGCDVLIMPWNRSEWIQACNPIKLKEYLAVGRPVVTTSFPEAARYRDLMHIVDGRDAHAFAAAIEHALAEPGDPASRRARVQHETWDRKAMIIRARLQRLGLAGSRDGLIELPHQPGVDLAACSSSSIGANQRPSRELEAKAIVRASQPAIQNATVAPTADASGRRGRKDMVPPAPPTAILIMAGATRPSPLMTAAGRHPLDLHITPTHTLLDLWLERLAPLCELGTVPIRIITSPTVPAPWPHPIPGVTYEQDRQSLRGSAGALRDACARCLDDTSARVLVVEAAALPPVNVVDFWLSHLQSGDDLTIGTDYERTPTGIMAIRCSVLRAIPETGYADLREQWLERLTQRGVQAGSSVVGSARARRMHDRESFIECATALAAAGSTTGPTLSDATSGSIICEGAHVHPTANVRDSVILPGARVGAWATVARSVVCSGCSVQVGSDLADAVFGAVSPDADHPLCCPGR